MALLGVNIDHIATVREARKIDYPDPVAGALLAEKAGCHGITAHLREDQRHIQREDMYRLKESISTRLNMEMAIAPEVVKTALDLKPVYTCLVPEKREEVTTEGGLAVAGNFQAVETAVKRLMDSGIKVSLFIDPDPREIEAAAKTGAEYIEIHTGTYANTVDPAAAEKELAVIKKGAETAKAAGLTVNAGHGLNYDNTAALVKVFDFYELNIGHSIIGRAIYVGMEQAVREMLELCS